MATRDKVFLVVASCLWRLRSTLKWVEKLTKSNSRMAFPAFPISKQPLRTGRGSQAKCITIQGSAVTKGNQIKPPLSLFCQYKPLAEEGEGNCFIQFQINTSSALYCGIFCLCGSPGPHRGFSEQKAGYSLKGKTGGNPWPRASSAHFTVPSSDRMAWKEACSPYCISKAGICTCSTF